MEKNLTIRTANEDLAEEIRNTATVFFGQHINFTWYDGEWQLSVDADEKAIKDFTEDLKACENFKEGRFTFTID